ncbi:DMSO/TMAO reductase YedYZ, molybdopterin-dependent catalytic subunit [Arthrobacter sp. ok909]|uniref:molybdopterin-dependent oxidoreductase n=1 Tax=Arthrobacter sp. ok909 TaxID=1761746 RepID=UPI00088BDADE|nr:molybdopterin-dependent oxidoreductase [Arthrobacter sp. ok909]SDP10096.1 DMSO/TMAO reductase YedYZ, molybdopterin-dependent catalytic subunit [Arthrobacter sp. ok909]
MDKDMHKRMDQDTAQATDEDTGKTMDMEIGGQDQQRAGTQVQLSKQPQSKQGRPGQDRFKQRRTRDLWAAAAGLVAIGTAVVLGELTASLVSPTVSPVTAVGGAVIDAVPPGVKEWVISVFGTADKLALLGGMVLVIAALAALSGVLEVRRRFAGVAVIAVFGAVGLVAVLSRADLTANAIPVPVLVALVGIALLRWLIRKLEMWLPVPDGARDGATDGAPAAATAPPATDPAETRAAAQPVPVVAPAAETSPPETPAAETSPPETPAAAQPAEPPAGEAGPARRRFLLALGGTAAVAAVAGVLASTLRGAAAVVSDVRSKLALPAAASPAPPIPAGAEIRLDGLGPLVTPNKDFYRIDTALRVPLVDPAQWTLKVTGLVEREIELDFATLLAKPLTERHVTIACVSNEVGGDLIGNAKWLGWPVRELLAMAGPKPGADMVLSRSTDGWTAGTPLEALTDSRDALLVVGMNGEPLPLEHGFPVRMIVPGLYGYVSATKWVTELKVTRYADDVAYWTPRGWSERGPIKTSSRIDVPQDGRSVTAGTVVFGGVAWDQHTGIGKVELRVNRGEWKQAELAPGISKDTWYQWKLALPLTPGRYEVQVRATDLDGVPQVEEPAPVAPSGATGFHTVRVDVKS